MPASSGPGPLAPVHRITIVTAFLGALFYLGFEVKQLWAGAGSWLRVALALAASAALGLYLRNLRARLIAHLTPRDDPPAP